MDIPANTKVPLDHPGNVPGAPAATSNRNIDDIKSNGGQNHNDFHTGEPRHMDGPASGSPGLGKGDKAEDREMAGAVGFGKLDDEIKYPRDDDNGNGAPQNFDSMDSRGVMSLATNLGRGYDFPLARLYRRTPFRVLFIIALWCAAEFAVCIQTCRPTTCTKGPCVWSLDDPTFGYAIPHKVDDWTAAGKGRVFTSWASEELSDFFANARDFIRGTDIRDVSPNELGYEERQKYRRRLKKKKARRWHT